MTEGKIGSTTLETPENARFEKDFCLGEVGTSDSLATPNYVTARLYLLSKRIAHLKHIMLLCSQHST